MFSVHCDTWANPCDLLSLGWNHFRSHICLTSLVGIMWEWQSDRAHLFIPARGKTFPKISQSVPGRVQVIFGKGSTFLLVWFSTIKKLQPFSWALITFSQNVLVLKIPILYPYPWWRCKKKGLPSSLLLGQNFISHPSIPKLPNVLSTQFVDINPSQVILSREPDILPF